LKKFIISRDYILNQRISFAIFLILGNAVTQLKSHIHGLCLMD